MRIARRKALSAGLLAVAAFATAVSTARAHNIEVSEQQIRAFWFEPNKAQFSNTRNNIQCDLTLRGSFHSRTFSKVSGQLIGVISAAKVGGCEPGGSSGEVFILEGATWHMRFASFTSTLPNITKVRVQLISFSFLLSRILPVEELCLYASQGETPAYLIFERNTTTGDITSLSWETLASIPFHARLTMMSTCEEVVIAGRATSVVQQFSTTKIRMRLVT